MAPNRSRSFCLQFTSLRRKEAKHSPGVACFACLVWAAWECYGLVVHLLTACGTRPGGPQQQAAPTWPEADAAWRMQRQHRLACVKRAAAQALHEACRACQAAGAACFEPQRAARQPSTHLHPSVHVALLRICLQEGCRGLNFLQPKSLLVRPEVLVQPIQQRLATGCK